MQTSFARVSELTSVRGLSRAAVRAVLLTAVLAMTPLLAQEQPQEQPQDQPEVQYPTSSFFDRVAFGFRGGGVVTSLERTRTDLDSTVATNPPTTAINSTKSAGQKYTGGATLQIAATDRVAINVDILYKRSGYDTSLLRGNQDPGESEIKDLISGEFERTRADYLDVPVLLRYYNKDPDEEGPRLYANGGVAFRRVINVESHNELVSSENLRDTDSIAAVPANRFILGAVAGAGVQFRTGSGLKIEVGARYTRWFNRAFDSGIVQSNPNQGEVLLGLTF